jgi:hypothetical protein
MNSSMVQGMIIQNPKLVSDETLWSVPYPRIRKPTPSNIATRALWEMR